MSHDEKHSAPTLFLLMAQYNGQTVVPLDQVCRDFFGHLTVEKLLRKCFAVISPYRLSGLKRAKRLSVAFILSILLLISTSAGRQH
jgi:hypothetical protein